MKEGGHSLRGKSTMVAARATMSRDKPAGLFEEQHRKRRRDAAN
jgi:hypothetical protein